MGFNNLNVPPIFFVTKQKILNWNCGLTVGIEGSVMLAAIWQCNVGSNAVYWLIHVGLRFVVIFWFFGRVCKVSKSYYQLRRVCRTDHQSAWENSTPHWTDFDEIRYLRSFRKSSPKNSSFITICQQ
jgi:hypothetical protein